MPFTLDIYKISRCTHKYFTQELRRLHITMGQFPFIMGIAQNDGISQEKLSDELMISKSTTAVIIRQLLKAGLITREVDIRDRRNFRLHATEKAMELVPHIRKSIDRCHEMIMEDLTELEKEMLVRLTGTVRIRTEILIKGKPKKKKQTDPDRGQ